MNIACAGLIGCILLSNALAAQQSFPAEWAGRWEGTLTTLSPPDSVRNRIPVSLTISRASDSTWTWRTVFNADTVRGLRDYRLIVRDATSGKYALDERNGVILEETLIDRTLISVFQVGTQVLESRYAITGDTLTHDIVFWNATPTTTSRGSGANSEGGVGITSNRVLGRQRAVFTRVMSR